MKLSTVCDRLLLANETAGVFIVKRTFLGLLGSTCVAAVLFSLNLNIKNTTDPIPTPIHALLSLVISPLVENALLVTIILLLSSKIKSPIILAFSGALVLSILHGMLAPTWGVFVFFSFFIFSVSYFAWKRARKSNPFLIIFAIHSLHNFPSFLATSIDSYIN